MKTFVVFIVSLEEISDLLKHRLDHDHLTFVPQFLYLFFVVGYRPSLLLLLAFLFRCEWFATEIYRPVRI
jgi:hypothetical protein